MPLRKLKRNEGEEGLDFYPNVIHYIVMKTMISLRLNDDLIEELDLIAKKKERSRSWLVKKATEKFLEEERERNPQSQEKSAD